VELKKGDVLIAEGDLYKRVYTLASGYLNVIQNGLVIAVKEEGDIFGYATPLFFLSYSLSFSLLLSFSFSLLLFLSLLSPLLIYSLASQLTFTKNTNSLAPPPIHIDHRSWVRHGGRNHHPRQKNRRTRRNERGPSRAYAARRRATSRSPTCADIGIHTIAASS
jgi:hypothetical protein